MRFAGLTASATSCVLSGPFQAAATVTDVSRMTGAHCARDVRAAGVPAA
jgi:hypothetical protein